MDHLTGPVRARLLACDRSSRPPARRATADALLGISSRLDPRAVAWVMLATHYGSNLLAVLDSEIDLNRARDVRVAVMFRGFAAERTGIHPDGAKTLDGEDE